MSDPSGSGFGKFVPGFEFLQNLAGQAASGVAQGLGNSLPQLPNLGHWVAPTFNVEDLEKRIEELKAVHFWLDQNSKALGATIQALEVQKMTLATLKGMNFSLGDVANALKIKAADTVAGLTGGTPAHTPTTFAGLEVPARTYGTTAAEPPPAPEAPTVAPAEPSAPAPARRKAATAPAAPPAAGGLIDPMHWWGALSQQFQTIAANAMKDAAKQAALDTTREATSGMTSQAVKAATGVAGKVTRGLTSTVTRNVGAAAGVGQAAARAVARRAPAAAPKRPSAPAPESAAAARRSRASAAASASQPLPRGEWPLPTAFFQMPGFSLGGASEDVASSRRAADKKAAGQSDTAVPSKKATKKSASRASAKATPRKTAAKPASKTAASPTRR
jgi:hypothetical protein